MQRIIKISQPNSTLCQTLAEELGINKILAQVFINRGIRTSLEAEKFLRAHLTDLHSPWQLKDMEIAARRVQEAVSNKEKVLIFGDYDVDGLTSVALLKTRLEDLGLGVMHYIPHRIKEGYGLSPIARDIARSNGIRLIITVDCGINSFSVIEEMRRLGVDVIVTDHHEPQGKIPPAYAVINPKQYDCPYQYKELAGVGVAYKFAQAITKKDLWEDLDLVALGTIVDVSALNGENRIMVKEGLKRLSSSCRLGIKALMEISGIDHQKPISTMAVSYILGPRINASGRMDTAEAALRLLLSQSESESEDLAKILDSHNRKRQKIEERILKEALALIDKEVNFKEHYVIVLSRQDWHPGVLGIVASKLMDRFYRPVILISEDSVLAKGSARSIKDFHIFQALFHCQEYLESFGGHKHAAGLVIARENIPEFRHRINHFAKEQLLLENLLPCIEVDMQIRLSDLNYDLVRALQVLEPLGPANPRPLFYTQNLKLKDEPQVFGKDTLKFWITDSEFTYPVIGFGFGWAIQTLRQANSIDLVYRPQIDNWRDNQDLILEAEEIVFR